MARIPDVDDFGQRSAPRAYAPRVVDRSGEIIAEAGGRFGEKFAQVASRIEDREDNFAYGQARNALITADVEARRQFENDSDWATYDKRYSEAMEKAREKAGGLIRSKHDRALFDSDARLSIERNRGEVLALSKRKEGDWGRATLESALESNRTAALNAKDKATRAELHETAQAMIAGAVGKGYLSQEVGGELGRRHIQSFAEGYVSMLPADERIGVLSKPVGTEADYIAPDKRHALLEAAKRESRDLTVRRESQAQEDAIVSKHGGDWTAALKAARDIEDPDVRDSTVTRVKVRQAESKQADFERRETLTEEALGFINDGGKFDDLPLKIKNGLKPSALNSLRSYAEQQASGGRRSTDPETLIELSRLSTDDPQKFGELDMLGYRDKLTDSDFEEFVDLQRKIRSGSMDGKATGFMTMNQVRDERLRDLFGSAMPTAKEADKVSAARRKFVEQYETRLRSVKQQTGKAPGADDARKILDDMTADVGINRDYWFDTSKPAYELTGEDVPDVPEADRNEIISELRKRGKPVTDQAIINLYRLVHPK